MKHPPLFHSLENSLFLAIIRLVFVLFFSWRFRVHRDVKQVDIMHGIAASKRLREAKGIRFHASYTFLLLLLYIYRYII